MLKERHAYIEAVFEIVDQALSYRKDNETQWRLWLATRYWRVADYMEEITVEEMASMVVSEARLDVKD